MPVSNAFFYKCCSVYKVWVVWPTYLQAGVSRIGFVVLRMKLRPIEFRSLCRHFPQVPGVGSALDADAEVSVPTTGADLSYPPTGTATLPGEKSQSIRRIRFFALC